MALRHLAFPLPRTINRYLQNRHLPSELRARLTDAQRTSFLQVWEQLAAHLREINFELHHPRWTAEAITKLGDALVEFSDVISTSKTDFGACNTMPFSLSLPPGTKPIASKPYRINLILQKKVDAVLDQYLAAGLIQHSTSPWASPLVVIPKKDGSVRLTVNYTHLKSLVEMDGQPLPREDCILDSLYKGKRLELNFPPKQWRTPTPSRSRPSAPRLSCSSSSICLKAPTPARQPRLVRQGFQQGIPRLRQRTGLSG